jgi:ADP-ribose pyrophosphatase YjhB (NUDIX family)
MATVTEACPLAPDARPTVVTAVIADKSHVLLLRRRMPQGRNILVLPATRVEADTSKMLSLEKACAEQISRFPDAFNDIS